MQLICPLCQQPLNQNDKQWGCENNHRFDSAKEGYVNLLPVQKKRSKQPGDDDEMMRNRQAFLNAGYYNFFAEALAGAINHHQPNANSLLDLGCGEGFYGEAIKRQLPALEIGAIDIAKGGVKRAAKRKIYSSLAVASCREIPYADAGFDACLSVFAPLSIEECYRTLKTGGLLVIAGPAPMHLEGLARCIYTEFRKHSSIIQKLNYSEHFELIASTTAEQTATVKGDAIYQLLTMTPYYWHASPEVQTALQEMAELNTPLAFEIHCLRKI